MATHIVRTFFLAVCASAVLLITPSRSHAETVPRIRSESTYVLAILAEASSRSSTLRALMHRIAESNVIAYVTCERFDSAMLAGRTLLGPAGEARYLRVQVDCMLARHSLVSILGHELQHAAEIAAVPDVVDSRSLARLFRGIGFSTSRSGPSERFETAAAIEAGERVREEYLDRPWARVRMAALVRSAVLPE